MHDGPEYEKAIKLEEEWWGKHLDPSKKDYRLQKVKPSPQGIWDVPDLEELIRGPYKKRLLYPSKKKGLRIMELGCGLAWLSLELARQGHRVDACDISEKAIEYAKTYYREVKAKEKNVGEINHFKCDLNKIDLSKDTYDFIVCWDALHHVVETSRLIYQLHSSLKRGGKFICYDQIGAQSKAVDMINLFMFCIITVLTDTPAFLRLTYGRIKRAFSRRAGDCGKVDEMVEPPFEGATRMEMIDCVVKEFGRDQVEYKTVMAIGGSWLHKIRGPRELRLGIASLVMKIDAYLIRKGFLKGGSVFMEATKS